MGTAHRFLEQRTAVSDCLNALDLKQLQRCPWLAAVEHHATLASTNDRARQLAAEPSPRLPEPGIGESTSIACRTATPGRLAGQECPAYFAKPTVVPSPSLIVAEQQTAGRGRGRNRWWTGVGSLAFSLLLPRPARNAAAGQPLLGLAAAVAVVEAAAALVPNRPIGLYWPNDVQAGDRKLAGVLVEVLADGRAIVGIGINVNSRAADAPTELQTIITSLADLAGGPLDRTGVLLAVLGQFERQLAALQTAPDALARRADELCLQRGQRLYLVQADQRWEGVCAGIAPDGALLLDTAAGRRAFYSGTLANARGTP